MTIYTATCLTKTFSHFADAFVQSDVQGREGSQWFTGHKVSIEHNVTVDRAKLFFTLEKEKFDLQSCSCAK